MRMCVVLADARHGRLVARWAINWLAYLRSRRLITALFSDNGPDTDTSELSADTEDPAQRMTVILIC